MSQSAITKQPFTSYNTMALPQTLPVNKAPFIAMIVIGLLITSFGLLATKHPGSRPLYEVAALGLWCCVYAGVSMRPSMSYLRLDENGLTVKVAFWSPRRINFADVSPYGFAVVREELDYVTWRYKLGAGPRPLFGRFNFWYDLLPYQDYLSFNYGGRTTQKMCELLNIAFTQKKHG